MTPLTDTVSEGAVGPDDGAQTPEPSVPNYGAPPGSRVVLKLRAIGRPRLDHSRCFIPVIVISGGTNSARDEREHRCKPSTARAHGIPCDDDGKVVVGGASGMVIKGANGKDGKEVLWKVLVEGDPHAMKKRKRKRVKVPADSEEQLPMPVPKKSAPVPPPRKPLPSKPAPAAPKKHVPGPVVSRHVPGPVVSSDPVLRRLEDLERRVEQQNRTIASERELRKLLVASLDSERMAREELQDFAEQSILALQGRVAELLGKGRSVSDDGNSDGSPKSAATLFSNPFDMRKSSFSGDERVELPNHARMGSLDALYQVVEVEHARMSESPKRPLKVADVLN